VVGFVVAFGIGTGVFEGLGLTAVGEALSVFSVGNGLPQADEKKTKKIRADGKSKRFIGLL
jgi:hypothetical protein